MLGWGLIVFIGLFLVFADLSPAKRAWLMGHPMLIHAVVIGSGLLIHGGSAQGAMAAVTSGIFSALYVRIQRRLYGYITGSVWYPGRLRIHDPRH